MFSTLHVIVFLPFLLALCTPGLSRRFGKHLGWAILPLPLAFALYLFRLLSQLAQGPTEASWSWAPSLGLELTLRLDGFSALFALLIAGIGALVTVYSIYYLDEGEDRGRYYMYILLFMGAMFGVVLSDNLLALYMFWEITSISSFLLIGYWHESVESRQGALKSMLVTVTGGFALLSGIVLLGIAGESFSLQTLVLERSRVQAHPYYPAIVLLILTAAFSKSAQAPFHLWLPGAMAAPTPVSAYLHSATMVKAGVFLAAKMGAVLGGTGLWFYLVTAVGMTTMALGSYLAVQQRDLKALLAFSTVSQLGLLMTMFGYGTPAAQSAGIFHLLNHALFKGSLFMLVGIIDHQTGTREIDRLSGLGRKMPVTASLTAIGALSMAGVPPLNGFVSKEMVLAAMLEPPLGPDLFTRMLPVAAILGSCLTVVYCLILAHKIFASKKAEPVPKGAKEPGAHFKSDSSERSEPLEAEEASWGLLAPPAILAALVVLFGLFPAVFAEGIVAAAVAALRGTPVDLHLALWHGVNLPLLMSVAAILLGLLGYRSLGPLKAVLRRLSDTRMNVNAAYEGILYLLDTGSKKVTRRLMTGYLRDYLVFILGFTVLTGGYGLLRNGLWRMEWARLSLAPITWTECVVLTLMTGGAVMAVLVKQRIAAALGVATTGFSVAMLWVLWQAPDLALTQTIVETISVVPLFLAFAFLPKLKEKPIRTRVEGVNAVVALAAGALVAGFVLISHAHRLWPSIGEFFIANSEPLGGGRNVVNVMLVDFRALDTMGETTVLAMVALAVHALVRSRRTSVEVALEPVQSSLMINPVILPAGSRIIFYLTLVFAIYIFLRGHHNPGGGFVAGVTAACATTIWALAYERQKALALVAVHPRKLIASGLVVIVGLGIAAMLAGYPFLTQAFTHWHVPILGDIELATALVFDLGVFMVVFGSAYWIVMTMADGRALAQRPNPWRPVWALPPGRIKSRRARRMRSRR